MLTLAALPSLRAFVASDESARPARLAVAQSELQAIVSSDDNLRAATIVGANGVVVLTTDDSMNADWSARAFVREGLLGHLYASAPTRDGGETSQYYAAPLIDNFGNVAGALVLRIAAQEMLNGFYLLGNVLILDENNVRIVDTTPLPQLYAAITPLSGDTLARLLAERHYGADVALLRVVPFPELLSQIQPHRAAQTILRDPNSVTYLAAIQPLAINPWSIVFLTRDDVTIVFANTAYWETFVWGAVSGLALTALGYFVLK
jgi:C4-dicarboxylate-specific signal transduction histidine kinase